jgi:hypothetical protein
MRSRFPLILVGLVALAAASLVMVGCSDDENPPTTNNNNHDELVLAAVTAQVSSLLDSAVAQFSDGAYLADISDPDSVQTHILDRLLGPTPPDSSEDPEDNNGWLVLYSTTLASGVSASVVDSLQYLDGSTPSTTPVGSDAVSMKHHYTAECADTTVTHTDLIHDADLRIDGIDGTSATILGEVNVVVDSKFVSADSTVRQHWNIEAEVNDVVIDQQNGHWTTGCPTSGAISVNVQYTYKKNSSATEVIIWTYVVTFTDGTVSVDVTNTNDLSTSYEDTVCVM